MVNGGQWRGTRVVERAAGSSGIGAGRTPAAPPWRANLLITHPGDGHRPPCSQSL
jgi:hypothetical protein